MRGGADTDSYAPAPSVGRGRHWFICSCPQCGERQTLIHMLLPPVRGEADIDSYAPAPSAGRGRLIYMLLPPVWVEADTDFYAPSPSAGRGRH